MDPVQVDMVAKRKAQEELRSYLDSQAREGAKHTHARTHTNTQTCTHTHIHTHTQARLPLYTTAHACTQQTKAHTHIHTTHARAHTHTHAPTQVAMRATTKADKEAHNQSYLEYQSATQRAHIAAEEAR